MNQHTGRLIDRRHWRLSAAGGMASLLDSAIISTLSIGLALFREEFGMSTWGVGALSATLTFSIAIGAFVGGRLADVFGRVKVFNIDILIYAIGVGLAAVAPNQEVLFVAMAIGGLAAGADLPTSLAVISERSPQGAQGRMVGFTQVMWTLGIIVTMLLGFAFSGMGLAGVRIIYMVWAVAALVTWAIRVFSSDFKAIEEELVHSQANAPAPERIDFKTIFLNPLFLTPLLLTGFFYISRNLLANTWGQFQTFFLIEVGGASQSFATGMGAVLKPISLVIAILFLFVVDTKRRNPMFYICGAIQILTLALAAISGGEILWVFLLALAIYNLSGGFAGEGIYKVWTQESIPVDARSTVQGVSYSISRVIVGFFAFVTPALIELSPSLLLWLLAGFATLAYIMGIATLRYLKRRGIQPGGESPDPAVVDAGSAESTPEIGRTPEMEPGPVTVSSSTSSSPQS